MMAMFLICCTSVISGYSPGRAADYSDGEAELIRRLHVCV
jgi:hypothetical protein